MVGVFFFFCEELFIEYVELVITLYICVVQNAMKKFPNGVEQHMEPFVVHLYKGNRENKKIQILFRAKNNTIRDKSKRRF